MSSQFHPAYFETRFRGERVDEEILEFAIITAYSTTGEEWSDDRNETADEKLQKELDSQGCLLGRMTGYSPTTGHAEPGWAARLEFDRACDTGLRYKQDAIYYVRGDTLNVSYCDERRELMEVGAFSPRFTVDS